MRIGGTATRYGLTPEQHSAVAKLFAVMVAREPIEFHEGDCIGGDAEMADIATRCGAVVHGWPSVDPQFRAYAPAHVWHPPMTNFARNRAIVRATELIIAAPYQNLPSDYGGTWYTINWALKHGYPVWIAWPDGRAEAHPGVAKLPGQDLTP